MLLTFVSLFGCILVSESLELVASISPLLYFPRHLNPVSMALDGRWDLMVLMSEEKGPHRYRGIFQEINLRRYVQFVLPCRWNMRGKYQSIENDGKYTKLIWFSCFIDCSGLSFALPGVKHIHTYIHSYLHTYIRTQPSDYQAIP